MNKKRDKASVITTVVVIILCVFFVGGFGIGLSIVLDMEGAFPPVVNEASLTPAPATKEEALDYLNAMLDKAREEKPKTEAFSSFAVDDSTLETDASAQFVQGFNYIKGDAMNAFADTMEKRTADFFEDASDFLRYPGIRAESIEDFTCDYICYQCSSCGKISDTSLDFCEDCGSERPYNETWKEDYTITLTPVNDETSLNACFAPRTKEEYLKMANDALNGKASLKNIDVTYTGLTIVCVVDRLFDELKSISYQKSFDVAFDASHAFTGEWSRIAGGSVKFNMTEKTEYKFTWPHLTLNEDHMYVEPKGNDNLLAALTCDDPTAYEVRWTVDDESIVTVDDEGYFKAGKNTGTTVIRASFEFGGKTYTDECEVEVKTPVERLSMRPGKVTLAPGETRTLSVKITPNNATIRDFTWYTEDESIAAVDENGTVRAVAPGTVIVYCLSNDNYMRSTCEVTVR